jgi:hypothetical protein
MNAIGLAANAWESNAHPKLLRKIEACDAQFVRFSLRCDSEANEHTRGTSFEHSPAARN